MILRRRALMEGSPDTDGAMAPLSEAKLPAEIYNRIYEAVDVLLHCDANKTAGRLTDTIKSLVHELAEARSRIEEQRAETDDKPGGDVARYFANAFKEGDGNFVRYEDFARLRAQLEAAKAELNCDACCGEGLRDCMCGGTGQALDAVAYLRAQLFDTRKQLADRDDTIMAMLEAAGIDFSDLDAAKARMDKNGPKPSDTIKALMQELCTALATLGEAREEK